MPLQLNKAKEVARVLERANYEEVGAKVAFAEEGGFGTAETGTETGTDLAGETDDDRDDVEERRRMTTTTTTTTTRLSAKTRRSPRVYTPSPRWTCAAKRWTCRTAAGKVSLVTNVASE